MRKAPGTRTRGRLQFCHVIVCAGLTLAASCGDCVLIARPALEISVVDSRTNASVLAGSTIIATQGTGTYSITVSASSDSRTISLAEGKSGRFNITVRRAGYQDFLAPDFFVAPGSCGNPVTEAITVRLVPTAP